MIEIGYTLHTALFEASEPKATFINPRCFGEDFACWLRERLLSLGLASDDPIQEDWGWVLLVQYNRNRFTISIGVMDDSIGCSPAEWRVGISYEKALNGIRAWFRPVPVADLSALAANLEDVLRSDIRLQNVKRE